MGQVTQDPTGNNQAPVDPLAQEATRLKAEITQLNLVAGQTEIGTDGLPAPTNDAVMAQKRLPALNDDYRALLLAQSSGKTPTGKLDNVIDPRTGEIIGLRDSVSGSVITLPKPAAADANIQLINGNLFEEQDDKSWKLIVDKTQSPGYQAPAAPAPVKTAEQLGADAKAIALGQGEALAAQWAADHANGKVSTPAEEAALKSKYDMIAAEYTAGVNKLTADTAWERGAQGRADAAAVAKSTETRAVSTETRAVSAETRAVEEAKANLVLAQAAEARAQGADTRAAQQQKVQQAQVRADAYNQQATEGQTMLGQGIKLGVAPSAEAVQQMYFDPHKRAIDVLEQAMAGPGFDPNARALSLIGGQMPAAPQTGPVAPPWQPGGGQVVYPNGTTNYQSAPTITPRAPMLGGPRAPMPYQ